MKVVHLIFIITLMSCSSTKRTSPTTKFESINLNGLITATEYKTTTPIGRMSTIQLKLH
jgi:hypothetical protein